MSVGVFSDKKHQPSEVEIREAIGSKFTLWQDMIRFIRGKYAVQEDFRFLYRKTMDGDGGFVLKGSSSPRSIPERKGLQPRSISARRRSRGLNK
jgi:hypothetical protein